MDGYNSNPPSISGSKNVLYPESITFSEKSSCVGRKCLMFLAILFFCAAAVFLALFLVYYFKYEDREKRTDGDTLCDTLDCVKTASMIAEKMDLAADPCEDFAEYACGNFYKTAVFKEGESRTNSFTAVSDQNNEVVKAILYEDPKPGDWNYVNNMKNLHKACMDEAKIEEIGVQPYLDTVYAKEWPTLIGQNWTGENFNLNDVITRYYREAVEPIYSFAISNDVLNSSRNTIHMADPSLGLSRTYLTRVRNDSVLMAYEHYLRDVAIELGAEPQVAAQDAAAVLDLRIELAKITVPQEERRDQTKLNNPTTLADLGKNYTYIDIPRAIRASFAIANMTVADSQHVNVRFPSYFEKLEAVLNAADNRALQNLFGFSYALSKVNKLTKRLRAIHLEFAKVQRGKKEETPRWRICLGTATGPFSRGMGKEFIRRRFSEDSKTYMDVMINNLKLAFKEILDDATWMGDTTKAEAYQKLAVMGRKIGYPDVDFSNEDIEERYAPLNMTADNFYANRETIFWFGIHRILERLEKPVDRNEWGLSTYAVNAYYSPPDNEIVFPAGILQPPFFSEMFPDSVNYGAIGMVIGHEITHGFDDQGSQYDKDGNLRNWWQPEDLANFKQKRQCIIDQYGNFRDDVAEMNVNGINTQGENVADNGGHKESFSAYKKLVKQKGEAKKLPGLDLTQDQLFFLGYAQLSCEKMTKARSIWGLSIGVHSPGRFRILGPLQNSPDFAKAYKCSLGSPMNPGNKCTVW